MRRSTLEFVSAHDEGFFIAFRKARNSFRLLSLLCFLSLVSTSALLAIELANYPGGLNRVFFYGTQFLHTVKEWLLTPFS